MQDKVVVVVGATGGIGSAVARKLADAGATLVLAARDSTKLDALASEISTTEVLCVPTDITDLSQVETLMQKAAGHFGQIDALVNAAGAGILKQWNKLEPADLDAMLDLNLKGSFYTSQAAANVMKDRKSGHICNVIGILGKHSMAMGTAYCASKFGVVGFSKCMADELRRYGIKFTLFYFGGVDSPFWDNVSLKVDRSKMLSTETAANAIMFALASDPQAVPLEINIQPESHLFF
ncbi:MAG: SDR family oxidoreductase [Microcoleus sp. PH2017_29_MFU_D_A]|jgi:NADP-dependent 3-hydroxy acid dehydrogenase YdfG|uniref:SDR family oxidoreductase n=1 Tax=unclassified Microcoleus TaxID=2642155 RepID=UPI001DD0FFAB|nr:MULTISPECIES: SDR family oxidoreductase [unclassified Microcoleus]MCC3419771.1 SDR family oxidoreductase [Microcoleus sp. PH2017_07_MST_O_A]MCC3433581.1 SDR family oxidoreductase [Microcoleus sp. PH2017_04_SCI_O_A]MCC3442378.1 SDR family oxidoreductase [Microcoleus sp. PH2017_03_ELD_O_A]MCC3465540.1 SDR family oxidoreductase [Microcoleus sp. PH2017_06_SFM_O_A]MCC3505877.1 SDR family oxidoreductase [Microcoleus sp. PH2017_19_SFW_U_A]MCC3508746.1 SDR family oxidoreductase [Microcoleus sp. PH